MRTIASPAKSSPAFFNRSSFWARYGLAAVLIIASALLYGAIDSVVAGGSPFLAFTPAVMVSAWFGGLGPGLFATVLGGMIGNFFWVDPLYTLVIVAPHELIHTLVFYAVGIAISLMSRALETARARAVAANGAKDHFIAVLSHELRNPLAAILSAVNELEEATRLDDKSRHDLSIIRRNASLQARLVDDLLDVSRVSSGKLSLQLEVCDAHEVLTHAIEVCRSQAQSKGLTLHLDLTAKILFVQADPARLQQVFWNLLRNAIKFTPSGGVITIRTRDVSQADHPPRLLVEVEDTGLGIEPSDLTRIFEPFEQGAGPAPQQAGGLGLGLALCKALIDMHGGVIFANSAGPGRGSTFTIELPTTPAPEPQLLHQSAPANGAPVDFPSASNRDIAPADASSFRILLVEDDPDAGPLMLRLLQRYGYDVTLASGLDLALREARQRRIDLLISDLRLPDGNGIDLLRAIRKRQPVRGICVSGYGSEVDQEKTRLAGFERHLVKPVTIQALRQAIEEPVKQ